MSKKKAIKELTQAQQAQMEQQNKDSAVAADMQDTVAGDLWNEIKDKDIEMFALPSQKVHMHCHPVNIEPSKLYLMANSTAVLPSLETAVGNKYVVELVDRFIVIDRSPVKLTMK